MEIIPAVLSNLHSTCREKLLRKNKIRKNILCGEVFRTLCENAPVYLATLLLRGCTNCFQRVQKSANTLSLTLMFFLSDLMQKHFKFFAPSFRQVCFLMSPEILSTSAILKRKGFFFVLRI